MGDTRGRDDRAHRGAGPFRHLVVALVAALALVVSLATLAATPTVPGSNPAEAVELNAKRPRPNIVVIMADDMRVDDLRWMPRTRHLIGARGARFTQAFSSYPLCCPARASFLTGQYSHNHHVWGVAPEYGFGSFHDRRTLPVWLRRAGYRTLFLGKYLNGYGVQRTVAGRRSVRYVPPGWADWRGSIDGGLRPGIGSTAAPTASWIRLSTSTGGSWVTKASTKRACSGSRASA